MRLSTPARWAALYGLAAAALAASWAMALTLPSLLLGVAFFALTMPAALGLIRRAVLGFVAYEIGLVALATLLAPTGWGHHPRVLASILLLLAGGILIRRGGSLDLKPFTVGGDRTAVGLMLATLGVVAAPQVIGDFGALIQRLSFGVDNANHLNLARAVQDAQRFVYDNGPAGLGAGNETYPQGLALAAGYTTWLIRGGVDLPSTSSFVWDMALAMHLLFASMVLFSAFLLQALLRPLVAPGRFRRGFGAAAAVVGAFVATGPLLFLQAFGFQTQILAVAAILALLWVVTDETFETHPHLIALFAGGCVMAVGQSWYIALPVPASMALFWAFRRRADLRIAAVLVAAAVAALGLYPMLHGPGIGQSGVEGALERLPIPAVALLVGLAGVTTARLRHAYEGKRHSQILVALGMSASLTAALGLYQVVIHGELTYYFWKILYLPALLLVIVAAVGVGAMTPSGREARRIFLSGVAAAWLLSAGTVAQFVRGVDGPAAGSVIAFAIETYAAPLPSSVDVVATSRCDPHEEIHTSWWLAALLLDWPPDRRSLEETGDHSADAVWRYAVRHPGQQVVAFVNDQCDDLPTLADRPLANLEIRPT